MVLAVQVITEVKEGTEWMRVVLICGCCKGAAEGCVAKTRSILTLSYPWKAQPALTKFHLYNDLHC